MATVISRDGETVLVDPQAVEVIKAIAKHNCGLTMEAHRERVEHFTRRISELGRSPADSMIVLANVDDTAGRMFAEALMPGHDWQSIRDLGQVPFARGIAERDGIQNVLEELDPEAAIKLREAGPVVTLMVADHGTIEVFTEEDWAGAREEARIAAAVDDHQMAMVEAQDQEMLLAKWRARCYNSRNRAVQNAPILIIGCHTVAAAIEKLEAAVKTRRRLPGAGVRYGQRTDALERAIEWLRNP